MTDRLHLGGAEDLRRWPSDPAHLIDTTRCPACFATLYSTRCIECGLDLGVPASSELLAASTQVFEMEAARQRIITEMRDAQRARERRDVSSATSIAAGAIAAATGAAVSAPVPAAEVPAAEVPAAEVPAPEVPARVAAPPAPPQSDQPVAAATPARRRSGVQVLLLTLGVVLISVTAIVFLFVAYLVATLEVRSAIIAGASVLVLGIAWLLRARRLPGTAEGVASVAVVLLLLDVWIVRANELFGTEALNAAAYTGLAFAIVAGVLAATRAVSGIRVPGFAAAALAPSAAFLLGFAADPGTATGAWLGGLAALVIGAATVAISRRSPERAIMLAAGFGGGLVSLAAAYWSLPEVSWGETWAFLAVAAGAVLILIAIRAARTAVSPEWGPAAAIGAGAAATLAPAIGIVAELDQGIAIWLAPASAGAVLAAAAGLVRAAPSGRAEARAAFVAAAIVAAIAAIPGLLVGIASVGWRAVSGTSPWQVGADERVALHPDVLDIGTILVPFVVAVGASATILILRSLHRFAVVPVAAAVTGLLVVGAIVPGAAVPSTIFVGVAMFGLLAASSGFPDRVPGLVQTLAVFGVAAAGLALSTAYANAEVWPWTMVGVIATAIAGRLLAPRVWSTGVAGGVGSAHLVVAMLLAAVAVFTLPSWIIASGFTPVPPWHSPWFWLGIVGAVLLAGVVFVPRLSEPDRLALVLPALAATSTGAFAAAFVGDTDLEWLPATLAAVVVIAALRAPTPPLVRLAFAMVGPLLLAVGLERALAAVPDAPPSILGAGAAVLLAAAIAPVVTARRAPAVRTAWCVALGIAGLVALLAVPTAGDQAWLLLVLLAPVPLLVAALDGDPIGGSSPSQHLSWLSLALAVAAVWTRLAGDGVDDVEAYTLPLAAALAVAAVLITWRRTAPGSTASGRTLLLAAAAAVTVLPSVASSADSELRPLVLVAAGAVVALAAIFLPETARAVPIRLLGVVTGWVAFTGAALVRASAIAVGEPSDLAVEFWPAIALAAGVVVAVAWARTGSSPAVVAEAVLAASVVVASIPTVIAIVSTVEPFRRAAVLFPLLAVAHIVGAAARVRPVAGPIFAWSTLAVLVLGGVMALVPGAIDPFDVVTAPIGVALIGAGAFRMRRSPALGSWPAVGPGLAVLLVPALIADFADPELWRIVALGVVTVVAVVVGAARRLQAPLLFGGAVLLVHAISQLWPWITWLYEAVWWWLWLGIAGVVLVALAATYERQLRLARRVAHTIAELR
ncbi:hypothetical protein [Agromyces sp. NPDC049794]|uniref:SCO7613 C-terminal domain-containing membrane protein n=1 Tax=unclassified Agromyces TaxID=2639701 RepID=UPI00340D00B7